MPFPYDFNKVKDGDFEPLAAGWYPFRIESAEETTSKSGNPMVKTTCVCLDPANAGRKVWHYVTFLPEDQKGAGISKHFVKCLGLDVETIRTVDPYEWQGKTFMGRVIIDEYQGKRNNKFAEISPIRDTVGEESPF